MRKHDSLTVEIARLALAKLAGGFTQDDKWITVHPNGPDHKGSPMLLDDQGVVKGGAGGKFTGKKISEIGKKGGGAGGVMAKPTPPDFLKNHGGNMGWNGVVYGNEKTGESIYVGGKEYKITKEQLREMKKYKEDYKDWKKQEGEKEERREKKERERSTYLDVPYAQKDRAKSAGAKWDPERKQWYVPPGEVPEKLKKYISERKDITPPSKPKLGLLERFLVREKIKPLNEVRESEAAGFLADLKKKRETYLQSRHNLGLKADWDPYSEKIAEAEWYFKRRRFI